MTQAEKHPPLDEDTVHPDPLVQLERWLGDAAAAGMLEPTAMTLATVGAGGQPTARVVLFKGLHDGGLTFYTNHESHKGADLATNPRCALVFWWDRLERQLRVEGVAEKLPRGMAEHYFHTRPRLSQLSALTSHQSQPVDTRAELERRLAENEKRLAGTEVPLPEYWGGYVVRPQYFEFWQGRRGRLHDRLVYLPAGAAWRIQRLEP